MRNYKSIIVIFLIGVVYAFSAHFYKPYRTIYYQAGGDAFGYYIYLPAFFIHHDITTLHLSMLAKYRHCNPGAIVNGVAPALGPEALPAPNGRPVIKYSMGVALMESPFFFMAHFTAGLFHQARDGFSMIYMYALQIGVILYVLVGFWFLVLILRRYFSDTVIAVVIFIIGLGTNLYYLESCNAPMSHSFLFFVYTVLIYATIRYYDTLKLIYILLIGFCCGLIVLIRANEAYACLIPVLWGLLSREDVRKRILLIRDHPFHFILAALMAIMLIIPQLLYWKAASGHYIYYSYGNEKFDFLHPRIVDGLFGFVNGWLAYSPLMYLALAGIFIVARRRNPSFIPLIIFIPLHIYIIYSWWCWFYMASYGSRPMTEAYPLLSMPLAYSVDWLWGSRGKKTIAIIIIAFFSWLVMFQTYQINLNVFNSEIENWRSVVASFGKTRLTYDEAVVVDTREFQPQNPVYVKTIFETDLEDSALQGSNTRFATSGSRSVCLKSGQSIPGFKKSLNEIGAHPGQWIKASVNCLALEAPFNMWGTSSLVVECTRHGKTPKWTAIRLQNKIDNPTHGLWSFHLNKWGVAYFYTQLPKNMNENDTVSLYVYNGSSPDVYIDDLKAELYDAK